MDESMEKQERIVEIPHEETDTPLYVDDLAAESDYWLTLTDAARVTRRQEITIRRWVTAGSLPVRRQRMGVNKRTRHVRASDLAQLTPIVDPTAAITGAPANADLLSIPVQQAHILAAHHDLMQQLARMDQTMTLFERGLSAQQTSQRNALEHLRHDVLVRLQQEQAQHERELALRFEQLQHQDEAQQLQQQGVATQVAEEAAQRIANEQAMARHLQGAQTAATTAQQLAHHVAGQLEDLREANEQSYVQLLHDVQEYQQAQAHHLNQLAHDMAQHHTALRDQLQHLGIIQEKQAQQFQEHSKAQDEQWEIQRQWNDHLQQRVEGLRRRVRRHH